MIETIADVRARYVWKPLLASYSVPHAEVKNSYLQGHDDGWNAAVAFYKELGKI